MLTAPTDLAIVLVAAGASSRMGFPKLWADFDGTSLLARAVATARAAAAAELVVVVSSERVAEASRLIPEATTVAGGVRRRDSVAAGLAASTANWVAVHDAARALAPVELFRRGLDAAQSTGAAVPVVPLKDTIKRVTSSRVVGTPLRAEHFAVQTPQIFRRDLLERALALTDDDVTDEAILVEQLGVSVAVFPGDERAFKITTPFDFAFGRVILSDTADPSERGVLVPRTGVKMRIGSGLDAHAFAEGVPLWLGGVLIPHSRGLAGHSDGDAAIHALIDALLGAAGRGDIGQWFPSDEDRWRGTPSATLLRTVWTSLEEDGWRLENVDLTIVAAEPRLADYRARMRSALAEPLRCSAERVSLKATTTDGLGALGRAEGVLATAVALLSRDAE